MHSSIATRRVVDARTAMSSANTFTPTSNNAAVPRKIEDRGQTDRVNSPHLAATDRFRPRPAMRLAALARS